MIKKILIFTFISIFLASCGKDWEQDYQDNGGKDRRNSYEFLGTFFNTVVKESDLDETDSVSIIENPLALKVSNIAAGTYDGKVYLSNNERIKWKYEFEEKDSRIAAGMCADEEMNIYVVTDQGYLYGINLQGEKIFKVKIDEKDKYELYSDLLFVDDNIIFSSSHGNLVSISKKGEINWEKSFERGITDAIAADEKGNLYCQLTDRKYGGKEALIKIDQAGNEIWQKEIENYRFFNYPAYYKGKIYSHGVIDKAHRKESYIFIHDTTGKELKKINFPITVRSLSVDNEENIYITAFNTGVGLEETGVFKLNGDGETLWKLYFNAKSATPVLLSENLAAFMGMTDEGPGIFFLDMLNGRLKKALTINNAAISTQYTVMRGPEIIFPKAYEYGFVRITNLAIDRIVPF
jgi:outer membrane protein assembly factor BamB